MASGVATISDRWGASAPRASLRLGNLLRLGLAPDAGAPLDHEVAGTWVEIGADGPVLHGEGTGATDLVLTDGACLDLAFDLPDAPLPDLRAMIAQEIAHRSPFADGMFRSIWQATEREEGGWCIDAALCLSEALDAAETVLADHGLELRHLRRRGARLDYAARPAASTPNAPRRVPAALAAPLVAAGIVILSVAALWGSVSWDHGALSEDAAAARARLSAQAAVAASARGVEQARMASAMRMSLPGLLAEALPDGVWLDQVAVEGDEVLIVGFGPSTTEVQRLLSDLPILTDVRPVSSITRDNAQALERFRIAATLATDPEEAAR